MLNVNLNDDSDYFFDKPRIIGFIGIENLMFAKRIHNKKVNYDLNLLINEGILKPLHMDPKLTQLLDFLIQHETILNFPSPKNIETATFFCFRGLLRYVASTPYANEPWKVAAVLFKGNIYLCLRDTEEKLDRLRNMSKKQILCTHWGRKFEQFIVSDKPDIEPNPYIPINEFDEFSLIFTTNLNMHTIVYGAEMDGIICDNTVLNAPDFKEMEHKEVINYLKTKKFVELKTCRHLEFPHQKNNFRRFKTQQWWCQSYLAGVETIVCGFRNDSGIVDELKVYNVDDLPKLSRNSWKPNVSMNFLDSFLIYVKQCLAKEIISKHGEDALTDIHQLPLISLLFQWKPRQPVTLVQDYNYADDEILTQSFIDKFGNMQN